MVKTESVKCPNCGGDVRGEGEIRCEYCGSLLNVRLDEKTAAAFPRYVVTFSDSERTLAFFNDLPGEVITSRTTDIPYKPDAITTGLPGGKLDPRFGADAREIIALFKTIQDALNSEDIDRYIAVFLPTDREYIRSIREIATRQFALADLKRYTVSVDFVSIYGENAEVVVTNESLTFPVVGPFERLEVSFRYKLVKYSGTWKIAGSVLEKKEAKASSLGKVFTGITIGVAIIIFFSVFVSILLAFGGACCGLIGGLISAFIGDDGVNAYSLDNPVEFSETVNRVVPEDDVGPMITSSR